jgi:hypothetical protein
MRTIASLTNDLYHYTSAAVGLDSIVSGMRLRLGLFEQTNDPREARERRPPFTLSEGVESGGAEQLWAEADHLLRRCTKIACFTVDYELPDTSLDYDALRGWAHPALWAHYGARHSGVCLRFSRSALEKQIQRATSKRGQLFSGAVEYQASPRMLSVMEAIDLEQVREFGMDAVVVSYIERHHRELFFQKHIDWAAEHEYRWVLIDPEPLPVHVSIRGCLTGIVLGDAFPPARYEAARLLAARANIELSRMHFSNGLPVRLPGPLAQEPASGTAARRDGDLVQRARELAHAEADADAARTRAEVAMGSLIGRIEEAVAEAARGAGKRPAVVAAVHRGINAVPPAQRRRAPGTPGPVVDYEHGLMAVVEHQPQHSFTLVVSAALQVVAGEQVHIHAVIETERWKPDGNERREVWRQTRITTLGGASSEGAAVLDALLAALTPSLHSFDELRSVDPSTGDDA